MNKTSNSQQHFEPTRAEAETIESLRRAAAQIQRGEGIDLDTAERHLRLKHSFQQ